MLRNCVLQPIPPNVFQTTPKFCPRNLTPTIFCQRKRRRRILKVRGSKDGEISIGDALAIELGRGIQKLNLQTVQKEEALKRSKELLFAEMCRFSELKSEDFSSKWRRMSQEERRLLAQKFVAGWSGHFHPLSAKSVKEMMDELLGQIEIKPPNSDGKQWRLFPDFGRLLGFSKGIVP